MKLEELKQAEFSDIEINAWMQDKRSLLSEAGFSDKEIDKYFGIKTFKPQPLIDELTKVMKERAEEAEKPTETEEKKKEPGIYPEKEPSWIQNFIRSFEPPWEEKGARATLAVEAAGKTGLPPHEFEPTTGEAISKGFKASVTGLLATGKLPEPMPESAQKYMTPAQRILMQGSTLLGDLPFMTIGALIGGGGGPPTAVGGAFALPAGIRKVLMDKYEKGEVHSFPEFWKRLTDAVYETLKGEATGVATGYVGVRVPGLGRVPAEVVTMVTVGHALEGEIPEPQEFIDGAIVIGGMRFSTHIAGKLRNIYWQSGKKPAQVIEDIKEDPSIKEDLLSENREVPDKYKAPEKVPKLEKKVVVDNDIITWIKSTGGVREETLPGELRDLITDVDIKGKFKRAKGIPVGFLNKKTGRGFDEIVDEARSAGFDVRDESHLIELIERTQRASIEGKPEDKVRPLTDETRIDKMWEEYLRKAEEDGISEREAKETLEREIADEVAKEAEFARAEREAIQDEATKLTEEVSFKPEEFQPAPKYTLIEKLEAKITALEKEAYDVARKRAEPWEKEFQEAYQWETKIRQAQIRDLQAQIKELQSKPPGEQRTIFGFEPEEGFRRKPEPPGEIEKPVKRSDIVNFLKEKLDVPIRTGRFWGAGRRYLGIFKLKEEVIRTKFASDIETICHELGHGLHKFLWPEARTKKGLSSKPLEPWRKELLPIATKARAGQAQLPEGFAEFIRLYVTNEKEARAKAPKFYKAFEKLLNKKAPEVKEILLETRKEFEKWIKQPSEMRVLSQISVGEREKRLPSFSDVYTAAVDDLHPLMRVVEEMTKGEKIPAEKDPYKLARLMRGWHGRAEHFLEYSPYLFKTYENVGKPLRRILEPVKDNLDEFRAFIVSKRAQELHKRGIETGILPKDAEFVVNKYEPIYGEIFKDLIEYQDATLAYLHDSGLISAKTAIKMKKLNQDYVPFYRVMETERGRGTGVRLQARQPIKRITGSWRDIQDPLESIIKNTYLYINLAEKNAVGQALVRLAEANEGMGKYVERIPEPKQVIKIREPELWGLLQKYGKWTETSKYKELQSEIKEKVTTGEEIKPIDKVEERVREALTSRGFSEGETGQIIERLKGAKTTEAKNKIIEKTIEKVAVIETTKEFGLDLPEGAAEIFRPSAFIPKDNVIAVWRAGKRQLYEVHPDIAKTMLALDRESVNLLISILGKPASWLRAGATLTPEFIARNPFRDQFSAFAYSKYNFAPGYDLAKGVFSLAKKNVAYQQWIKAGGLRSMLVSMDRKYLQKNLGQVVQKTPVRNVLKNPIEALRILSEMMEAGTRLGEFRKGIKKEGVTKTGMLEAAYASREVTLDFARIGAKTRAVNTLIAFWNANVQGTDKMVRAFKEQPAMTTAKVAAGITLPSVILTIVNRQDERWKEIPQWQKDLFWIVMTEDHIWRIPKPFELGIIFGTVPERITEAILDKDPHAFDGLLQAIGRGASPGAIPTVAIPWMENWANRSLFLDRPIVPAAREKVLPEYQYKPYTTEVAKLIGRVLGELPPLKKSPYISPARIENLIRGWSGGLGIHILKIADEALRRTGVVPETIKPSKTWADIPLIKGFAVRHPSGQAESIKKFYDNYQDIEQIIATIKTLSKKEFKYEEAITILEEDAEQVAVRLTGIHKGLSNAQNTISFIYENPDISSDEKRQLIDLIYYQMIEMARAGNNIIKQIEKLAKQ